MLLSDVTFDGANKLIILANSVYDVDVVELYSVWKTWMTLSDNAKYVSAMRTVAGDPTIGAKKISPHFFLMNGWKLRPSEADQTLTLTGNLYADEAETYGANITVPTLGDYTVTVNMSTSSDSLTTVVTTEVDEVLQSISDNVVLMKKVDKNRWKIENDQMIIYDDDGYTPLLTFNLSGSQQKTYSERMPV